MKKLYFLNEVDSDGTMTTIAISSSFDSLDLIAGDFPTVETRIEHYPRMDNIDNEENFPIIAYKDMYINIDGNIGKLIGFNEDGEVVYLNWDNEIDSINVTSIDDVFVNEADWRK